MTKFGPVKWMAPEALAGRYSAKSDVYSFGMTCYEILEQMEPFYNVSTKTAYQCILHEDRPVFQRRSDTNHQLPGAQELIRACWAQDPAARPTIQSCVPKLERIRASHIYQAVNTGMSSIRASD